MDIPISTPALLFPAIAILMLGYINRYLGTASLIRTIVKDYDQGYARTKIVKQLSILKTRIELSRFMLSVGAFSLILACLSMFLIFAEEQSAGNISFGAAIVGMILSIFISAYETYLSNQSLILEIDNVTKQESNSHQK